MLNDIFDGDGSACGSFYRQIVMESADAIVAVNPDHKIVLFSPAAEAMFGYSSDEVVGQSLDILLPEKYRSGHASKVKNFRDRGTAARYMGDRKSHLIGQHRDGSEVIIGATILTAKTEAGPIMVSILRDIGKRIELQEELARLANGDPLTGQLNRRAFLESFEREWKRAKRYQSDLALLMFDLDDFKRINDVYGHDAGDRVICHFAETARSMLRDIDIFGRWGGEEFIAALPHADIRSARSVAERIRENFSSQVFVEDGSEPFSATVSIGVADIGKGGIAHNQMVKFADIALYEAKGAGRNQVVTWNGAGGIRAVGN